MKRLLLAATAALALSAGSTRAQGLPVYDLKSDVTRAAEAVRSIQQAVQQYRMLEAAYNALAHSTDAFQVAGILGGATRSYMPEAGQAMGLFAGSGSMYGAANSLMAVSRYIDTNDGSTEGEEMARRERATANFRAVGFAGMASAQESIGRLSGLLDRITSSPDVTDVSAVSATIATEQQNIAHHQAQIAQTQLVLLTENRVDQQRAQQRKVEGANFLIEATQPLSGSLR